MRIAYISDTYLPETNGIVTAIVRHSQRLAERGHEFLVLCPRYGADDPGDTPGVTVERYRAVGASSNGDTHVALPWPPRMVARLRRFDPDVVHVHTPLPIGVCGVLAARWLHVPLVQTYHSWVPGFLQYASPSRLLRLDRGPRRTRDTWLARMLTRALYDRSDLVLAPSETVCEMLRDQGLDPPARYQTNGIDVREFPAKPDWTTRGRIMHCGRMGFEKNAEVVLEAFSQFRDNHPGWELHLLGEGPATPYLRGLARRLGIEESVRTEGFVDRAHLAECYREADIYATASTIETQGLVVLEAMSSGTPVVGVDALAVPEMAPDGRSGIIVQPYDARAMAEAFDRLADDDALRERMGREGVRQVRSHDLTEAVDRLEDVYRELAAAGGMR